jgi:hypothetical protein
MNDDCKQKLNYSVLCCFNCYCEIKEQSFETDKEIHHIVRKCARTYVCVCV